MDYTYYNSPIGIITIAADAHALRELHIEGDRYFGSIPPAWRQNANNPILMQTQQDLAAYFSGASLVFTTPVTFAGTTFQESVWHALQNIPAGQTLTYAELAQRIGKPKAIRAVGTAVGKNPLCIVIPCHRIIAGNGGLGGYVAGLERKQFLLNHEQHFGSVGAVLK